MLVAPLWEKSVNVKAGHGINTRSNQMLESFVQNEMTMHALKRCGVSRSVAYRNGGVSHNAADGD